MYIVSTAKYLAADVYYFSLLCSRTLGGKSNPDWKSNLNGYPSMCHSIHIWIIDSKSYIFMKMTKSFYLNDKLNYITIFSEKFQNQCKEQTNNKIFLKFLHYMRPRQWRIQSFFGQTGYILEFHLPLSATIVGGNF